MLPCAGSAFSNLAVRAAAFLALNRTLYFFLTSKLILITAFLAFGILSTFDRTLCIPLSGDVNGKPACAVKTFGQGSANCLN